MSGKQCRSWSVATSGLHNPQSICLCNFIRCEDFVLFAHLLNSICDTHTQMLLLRICTIIRISNTSVTYSYVWHKHTHTALICPMYTSNIKAVLSESVPSHSHSLKRHLIRLIFSLRKHAYSNILKILPPKNENFQIKNSDTFFKFLLKT